jgi:hypothetical protein
MLRTSCTLDQVRGCCKEMRREVVLLTKWHIHQRTRLQQEQEQFLHDMARLSHNIGCGGGRSCFCKISPGIVNPKPKQKHRVLRHACAITVPVKRRCRTESACFKNVEDDTVDALVMQVCRCSKRNLLSIIELQKRARDIVATTIVTQQGRSSTTEGHAQVSHSNETTTG